jgi:hypothetical protein
VAATSNGTTSLANRLDCPVVGWPQRNEGDNMMNHTYGWMGGEMWVWSLIGVLVVVLLVVAINKLSDKKS